MARINVEDNLLTNPRFQALVSRMGGDTEKAIGRLIRFWWAAQRHWCKNNSLIPLDEFELGDFGHLKEVGLAEIRADGVYARGAKEHFEWYRTLIDAAAKGGRKSAESRREKYGNATPHNARNAPKQNRTDASVETENGLKTALKDASDEAKSADKSPKQRRTDASVATEARPKHHRTEPRSATEASPNPLTPTLISSDTSEPVGSDVWSAYETSYRARYGVSPVRNAKVNAQCAQLVKRLGGDAAVGVVRFYVGHQNAFYVQKAHALGLCLADAEALHTQWKNNTTITRSSASHADKNSATLQAFKNVAARWAERKEGESGDGSQ